MDDGDPLVAELVQARRARRLLVVGTAVGIVAVVVLAMAFAAWRWVTS